MSIILLNMLRKLIEKIIARQLQFDTIKYSILYSNQLEDVIQWFTKDAGVFLISVFLIHLVYFILFFIFIYFRLWIKVQYDSHI